MVTADTPAFTHALPLGGRQVCTVRFSSVISVFVRLEFWPPSYFDVGLGSPDPEYNLDIEGSFSLRLGDQIVAVHPGQPIPAECLRLIEKSVARAAASDDGALLIEFADGDQLTIDAARYEPWQVNGDDGYLVVSIAGGGLAVWSTGSER
jgi:hypothetical protein